MAGSMIRVATPASSKIADMKTPTVLYGTSGAARSGMNPTPMTITFRVILRAGQTRYQQQDDESCSQPIALLTVAHHVSLRNIQDVRQRSALEIE